MNTTLTRKHSLMLRAISRPFGIYVYQFCYVCEQSRLWWNL